MSDPSTEVLSCADCGKDFHRINPMGRRPKRCPECALNARRTVGREWARKDAKANPLVVPSVFACIDCSGSFERPNSRGSRPLRCKPCLRLQQAQNLRQWRADKRAGLLPRARPLTRPCVDCSAEMALSVHGTRRLRCDSCAKLRNAALKSQYGRMQRSRTVRPRVFGLCRGCGVPIEKTSRPRRERCRICAATHKREMLDQWMAANPEARREAGSRKSHRRRAALRGLPSERFSRREIYDRDRWKCGICNTRIRRNLRYPHPMSASLDHLVPVSQGGPHTRANVRASHLRCNTLRRNRGGNEQLALIG